MKVLFVSAEVAPFHKVGGLGDVAGTLPLELARLGVDVSVVMPLHRDCHQHLHMDRAALPLRVDAPSEVRHARVRRAELGGSGVPVYFIEYDQFFGRPEVYGHYPDAPQPWAFFARAVLALMPVLGLYPDVVHCHDWATGLLPVFEYLRPNGRPTVYTIHNLGYQGRFPLRDASAICIDPGSDAMRMIECCATINFMAAAIKSATVINTVSERYAQEIQTAPFGMGLDWLLRYRSEDIYGILNGISYDEWHPANEDLVAAYSAADPSGKRRCKAALQRELGLPIRPDVPLLAVVSRLAPQKGLDVLAEVLPEVIELPAQFVLLGDGEGDPADTLKRRYVALQSRYPRNVVAMVRFDLDVARRVYAGADMFVMPSRYEPCGLGQMIAMAHGTVPIVNATGGLADTVSEAAEEQTGFLFTSPPKEPQPAAVLAAIKRAVEAYADADGWEAIVRRAMSRRFTWERSAPKYVELYERAIEHRG